MKGVMNMFNIFEGPYFDMYRESAHLFGDLGRSMSPREFGRKIVGKKKRKNKKFKKKGR